MKVLVVFVAVACLAHSALSSWAGYYPGAHGYSGAYHGPQAAPVVTPSGFLADTPEVAAAKAAHLNEVARASSHAPAHGYAGAGYAGYAGGYHGPLAAPVVTPSGFLADTPEVAAAKAAHLTEVARASSHAPAHGYAGAGYAGYARGYYGSQAAPVVTPSGFLADTPEVAAAKAAHLNEVARASSHAPAHGYAGAGYAGYARGYYGSQAAPIVTPSGFLADTPEVAAAKAAHLSLVHGASHGAYAGVYHGAYPATYQGASYNDGSYHGEGAYSGHYDDAGHYDDGSYKPQLYKHGHY